MCGDGSGGKQSVTTRLVVVFTFYESRAGLIRKIYLNRIEEMM
jgi:hypothetical protein